MICSPTLNTGFSELIGSWKIIAMSLAAQRAHPLARSRSRPCSRIWLSGWIWACCGDSRRMITIEVTDLPEPDSPTKATVRLAGMSKLTPLSA